MICCFSCFSCLVCIVCIVFIHTNNNRHRKFFFLFFLFFSFASFLCFFVFSFFFHLPPRKIIIRPYMPKFVPSFSHLFLRFFYAQSTSRFALPKNASIFRDPMPARRGFVSVVRSRRVRARFAYPNSRRSKV